MADRTRIGIPFNYDENWIGGAYYIKNLVSSFSLLPAEAQPDVVLISHKQSSFRFIKDATGYGRLSWTTSLALRGVNGTSVLSRLRKMLGGRRWHLDVVFPYDLPSFEDKTICWIPDFQEKHYPNFFSTDELQRRDEQHRAYFRKYRSIIFSSKSALDDFRTFYPGETITPYVVNFAVFNERNPNIDVAELKSRLNLPERIFYSPNQFWVHKNHIVVLEALRELRDRGKKLFVAFSGKEYDPRAPHYADDLKQKVADWGLQDQVAFLGFLPRDEQLALLANAVAVIQPSLFEGWSTVVEDAKACGQFVIASDLPVHREQLTANCAFFDPRDKTSLAQVLEQYVDADPVKESFDYRTCQLAFAKSFMNVVSHVTSGPGNSSP